MHARKTFESALLALRVADRFAASLVLPIEPPLVPYPDGIRPLDPKLWSEVYELYNEVYEFRNPPWLDDSFLRKWRRVAGKWGAEIFRREIKEEDSKALGNALSSVRDWVKGSHAAYPAEVSHTQFKKWLGWVRPVMARTREADSRYEAMKRVLIAYAEKDNGQLGMGSILGVGLTSGEVAYTMQRMYYDGLLKPDKRVENDPNKPKLGPWFKI